MYLKIVQINRNLQIKGACYKNIQPKFLYKEFYHFCKLQIYKYL